MPDTLATDTTNFVLVSTSGETIQISGFTSDVQVIIKTQTGLVKIASTSGLTASSGYNDSLWLTGSGEIVFEGSPENANSALQTLQYKNSGSANGKISVVVGSTGAFYQGGHYYKYDTTVQAWEDHSQAAAASRVGNCPGYLATVTSTEEYNFILDNISTNNGWLGGSDAAEEGTWKWEQGPEKGKTFYCDNSASASCSIDIDFHKFPEPAEPNNCCGGEHHLQQGFGGVGRWNDHYVDMRAFYEYGGDLNQDGDIEDDGESCYPNTTGNINVTGPLEDSGENQETSETYNLDNSGNETLPSPFKNKNTVALVDAQKSIANRKIYHSIDIIIDRIEWFWRNRRKTTQTKHDLKLTFEHKIIDKAKISTRPPILNLANALSLEVAQLENIFQLDIAQVIDLDYMGRILGDDFSTWSIGEITIGKTNETDQVFKNSFQTEDITIGIDKKIQSHSLLGLALKIGYDYSDLRVTGTSLGTHNLGISIYYSELLDKNTNFKYVLGINKLDIKTIRYFKNNLYLGNRNAYQVLQSFLFEKRHKIDNHYFSPYLKADVGYSELRPYLEREDTYSLGFNEMKIRTVKGFLGLRYDNQIIYEMGRINPYINIEFGLDFSNSPTETAYYLSNSNVTDFYTSNTKNTQTYKVGLGLDYNFYTGNIGAVLESYREDNAVKYRTNKFRLKALFFF